MLLLSKIIFGQALVATAMIALPMRSVANTQLGNVPRRSRITGPRIVTKHNAR